MPFDLIANVAVAGVLTGLVYGLMALGLSVIFGVVRIVNFAHGELMTLAMYMAVFAFGFTKIDPLLLAVVAANVAGLVLLQAAFQRGRAAVIVPLQLAMANAIAVVAGVMIFAEHVTAFRALGIALIIGGTVLLHVKPHKA